MNELYFDTDLLATLPTWYKEVLEYQQICEAEGNAFEGLAEFIQQVYRNLYFQTMDEGAVSEWEQVFQISPALSDTLEFRRVRVQNRLATRPPFSLNFLKNKLDELIGENQWNVIVDYPNYTLFVESSARDQAYASELAVTIGRIKPAHIIYINRPYTKSGLLLSEQINLAERVWKTRLGSWGLGIYPFAVNEPRGVIKLPTVNSVQDELLEDVASYVSTDVATALINGTITISELTKSVSDNVLTVTYTVTPEDADEVTSVELIDGDGNILTSSAVYVPISTDTQFEHVIPVNEGVVDNG